MFQTEPVWNIGEPAICELEIELPAIRVGQRRKNGGDRVIPTRNNDPRLATDNVVHRSIANTTWRVRSLVAVDLDRDNDFGRP